MRKYIIFVFFILSCTISKKNKLSVNEYIELAQNCVKEEKYIEAVKHYKKILQYYPNSEKIPEIILKMANIYLDIKKPKIALKFYQKIIIQYPNSNEAKEALLKLGECYRKMKCFEKALEIYNKLIKEHPNTSLAAEAQLRIGECYMDQKKYDEAIKEFLKVIDNYPFYQRKIIADVSVAECYFYKKDFQKAIIKYHQIIKNYDPNTNEDNKMGVEIAKSGIELIKILIKTFGQDAGDVLDHVMRSVEKYIEKY